MNNNLRAKKNKPVQKTMLLVVEGTTEKIYFERLKGYEKYSSLKIKPDLPKHSNLKTLLEHAKIEQKTGVYDYVWLIFDRDVLLTQKLPKSTLDLSKLPPAEPVALIRHKWPATSCGKPLRNASHRVF